MELNRRRFFGLLGGAAAAAGASILAPGAGERLTVAPAISPESYTPAPPIINAGDRLFLRATVPDPLDARNWGKAQLAPMGFYEAAAHDQRTINTALTLRLEQAEIMPLPKLRPDVMYFLAVDPWGCLDPRRSAVITNIRAPGPCFDEEEEAA